MATEIVVPDLGDSVIEATILRCPPRQAVLLRKSEETKETKCVSETLWEQ